MSNVLEFKKIIHFKRNIFGLSLTSQNWLTFHKENIPNRKHGVRACHCEENVKFNVYFMLALFRKPKIMTIKIYIMLKISSLVYNIKWEMCIRITIINDYNVLNTSDELVIKSVSMFNIVAFGISILWLLITKGERKKNSNEKNHLCYNVLHLRCSSCL